MKAKKAISGTHAAFVIRGGPNSELFMLDLRKLFKFFVVQKIS